MFLNCNYPNKCSIPKGKPKELKRTRLEIKKGNNKIWICENGNVYFEVDRGYYWGIELPKFIVKTPFGVNISETIGKINLALLDWGWGRNELATLSNEEEDLLRIYLMTIK